MEKQLNEKNYIAIADWMITELDLSSRELLAYAIIYGFSQDGESCFSGSLSYLANWLNMNDRGNVTKILNKLIDKGLIVKEKRSSSTKTWCEYRVTDNKGETIGYEHIVISPWMIRDLGLKDKELILYSLLYGFSRLGSDSFFFFFNSYMCKWLGVDKQHVNRYTSSLFRKGLVERIEDAQSIRYRAVIPENGMEPPNQKYNTLTTSKKEGGNQNYNTPNQKYNSTLTKFTTNNLNNTLLDNLDIINNNSSNNLGNSEYPSKEDLSVVVNEEIPVSDFSMDSEKEAFVYKQNHDHELCTKYIKKNPYLPGIMKAYALDSFRIMLARWPDTSLTDKAESLLIDSICSSKSKDSHKEIMNLGKEKLKELFRIALCIYDPDDPLEIHKSKKAYLIGTLEIMLQET